MAYMSKTKRKRVRRQQLIKTLIAIAIIFAVVIIVWQIGLGSTLAKVNGVSIREGMVKGVEAFINYTQTGQFTNYDSKGLTGEEKETAENMALISHNSMVQNVFISFEIVSQHFKAQGKIFPDDEKKVEIQGNVDALFANTEMSRTLRDNGVNRSHVEYYYTYMAAMSAYKEELIENEPITDEELQQCYELYKFYFTTPLKLSASHILIMDADHTPEKRAEIEAILEQLNEGADFAELAMQYSEDGSAASGGDLGEFSLGQMVAPFEEACLALEPGEISDIVETEFGFHIIKLNGKTEESTSTIDEVRDQLEEVIGSDRVTEAISKLVEEANIEYFGLINPTTGKPPISLAELDEARGIIAEDAEDSTGDGTDELNDIVYGDDDDGHGHDQ